LISGAGQLMALLEPVPALKVLLAHMDPCHLR
jgi:hypothetical protein